MEELNAEREQARQLLQRIRTFIKDVDSLSDREAFEVAKNLREDVGKYLNDTIIINLIDRTFLMYVGFPRFVQCLDDIGVSNMELLLLNILNICDGRSVSLDDTLKMLTKI